jgi:hypothetical protein
MVLFGMAYATASLGCAIGQERSGCVIDGVMRVTRVDRRPCRVIASTTVR